MKGNIILTGKIIENQYVMTMWEKEAKVNKNNERRRENRVAAVVAALNHLKIVKL